MEAERQIDLQNASRGKLQANPEQTHPGAVHSPPSDIFETQNAITLLVDMPGVKADDLEIDLRDSVLTLRGRVGTPEAAGESEVVREYLPGIFFRQFRLADSVNQSRIDAKLIDGVLRLELPKVESAKPRQITVKTA